MGPHRRLSKKESSRLAFRSDDVRAVFELVDQRVAHRAFHRKAALRTAQPTGLSDKRFRNVISGVHNDSPRESVRVSRLEALQTQGTPVLADVFTQRLVD